MIEERTTELTEMRLLGDARLETIVLLEAQIEEMKERFRLAEEDTRATIDALTISQRQLQEQNERLADDLKRRNQDALQAIQEMKLKRVEVKTQGVDLHRVVNGKVTKVSEKVKIGKKGKKKVTKRQWDSGFGVDENVEDDELNGEEPLAA
jgi:myosin protein heavy chain